MQICCLPLNQIEIFFPDQIYSACVTVELQYADLQSGNSWVTMGILLLYPSVKAAVWVKIMQIWITFMQVLLCVYCSRHRPSSLNLFQSKTNCEREPCNLFRVLIVTLVYFTLRSISSNAELNSGKIILLHLQLFGVNLKAVDELRVLPRYKKWSFSSSQQLVCCRWMARK